MDTLQCLRAAEEGKIDAAFIMGGNLYGASPDSKFVQRALSKIPLKVFLTTTLNQGHFRGRGKNTLILPVLARDEERQATTQESMFNFIRMSDGGCPRLNNVRSEVEIIAQMAESIVGDGLVDFSAFRKHRNIREAIGHIVPGFNKLITIDDTKEEFHISGRTFHKPLFPTGNGKALFTTVPIPKMNVLKGQFYMASIRSEGQFNTIIYEDVDTFRNVLDRWVVLMNLADMQALQLKDGDCVNIKNDTGIMKDVYVKSYLLPPGNIATYFPESNVLIPAIPDSQSQTPAYKSVIVSISPAT
jgi:anaerobic selenocysteine-containing dehydrogenase